MSEKEPKMVTRREFLKWAGVFAAAYGLSSSLIPTIAKALEEKLAMHPIIWLQGGSCTGCSISFLNVVDPDIKKVLLDPVVPAISFRLSSIRI